MSGGTVKCAEGLGPFKSGANLEREANGYRDAANAIMDFDWASTPEGSDFWQPIFARLCELRDLTDAVVRRAKALEPIAIADESRDIHRVVCVSGIDGLVRWSSDGEVRDFCPSQARKAAAALNKMADAVEGV